MLTPSAVKEILEKHGLKEEFCHLWNSALIEALCLAIVKARTEAYDSKVLLETVQDILAQVEKGGFNVQQIN